VIEHQATGLLVPALSTEAFADALGTLVSDPDQRWAVAADALARVQRDHSLSAMSRAYEGLYRELAGER